MESVRILYDLGFPTLLPRVPILAQYVRELGAPIRFRKTGRHWFAEWAPIYPDSPDPAALRLPIPEGWAEGRTPVALELA